MKSLLNVCMYSGMCHLDPKTELSDEDTQILRDKTLALKEKPERDPYPRLGRTDQLSVTFYVSEGEKLVYLLSYVGTVSVYWNNDELPEHFKDTENINGFLQTRAAQAIQHHYEDMLRLTQQEEI